MVIKSTQVSNKHLFNTVRKKKCEEALFTFAYRECAAVCGRVSQLTCLIECYSVNKILVLTADGSLRVNSNSLSS